MTESIPQRVERIMHDQNVGLKTALRVAFAERRFEERRSALLSSVTDSETS
jgi:hypothetical protein